MFGLVNKVEQNTLEVFIDYCERLDEATPFLLFVKSYAKKYGLEVKTVDYLYQYKFADDEYDIRMYWFAGFSIFVYVPLSRDIPVVRQRLIDVIREVNAKILKARPPDFYKHEFW